MTVVEILRKAPGYQALLKRWSGRRKGPLRWGGLWGSSKTCLAAALAGELQIPLMLVVADPGAAELALDDLAAFGAGGVLFPSREGRLGAEPDVLRDRFHALELAEREGFTGILVAPLAALLQPVPPAGAEDAVLVLEQGMHLDPEALLRRLVKAGFERVPALGGPGEVARRGDILDLHAPALAEPLRLEFLDEELESVRVFDLATQRTRHVLRRVQVPLAHDLPEVAGAGDLLPLERLPKSLRVLRVEPAAIADTAGKIRFQGPQHVAALERLEKLWPARRPLDLSTLPGEDGSLATLSVEEYCRGVADGAALLAEREADGEQVFVFCATTAEADRLGQILADRGLDPGALRIQQGGLDRGFRVPEARVTALHHRELVPGHGAHRPKPRRRAARESQPLETVLTLKPGDLVVHAIHGLARFRGLEPGPPADREGGETVQDVLVLEFAQGALLSVPVSRVDLVERYIGAGGASPELDRLGSGGFERRRRRVQAAVEDMAADMLEVQARRASQPGIAIPEGEELQREFEASFPFEDTPDQAQGTRDIHVDLGSPKSMDRLLCGDVGYGKTELAARAVFRVIQAGYQAAVLVPTTVLAEQHLRSFRERFADYPVNVRHLSRLVAAADRRQTLEAAAAGAVDLVIGTHRLLSRDVQFKNLGLLVIDEEQRFGVRAKETLKKKRVHVDVLTLSATPIPRTLHMALAGIRDITSLSTPPAGRSEIHTELRFDDEDAFLAEALQKELARGGQVYFVHNRVRSLEKVADRVRRLAPGAQVVTAHGQMEPRRLESAMLGFVRGEADVLCCTTIVENGLDIANANTIVLSDAQRYGLAEMHQLRGRVGRSQRRSYCYLLIPRGQPLPLDARRRLKAIEELRYLGAGFQVAMRDLEIRGAGNLLGSEQSGHIAAVGYETYRRLLAQAVARLKRGQQAHGAEQSEPAADVSLGVAATLPGDYVSDEDSRLQILRDFDRVREPEQVDAVLAGMRDRFGPPPEGVVRLARLFFLKHRLGDLGLDAVQRLDDRLVCTLREARRFERALRPARVEVRVISPRRAHWMLPAPEMSAEEVLDHVYATASACPPARRRRKSPASPATS